MPPPRAEEVEDSDSASDSADSASDSEAAAPVAVAPSAVVTAEAASARAAALAEQLAARTGTVPVEGTASPGRPKETAAPGADLAPLILEAEPIDLVVIGNAANCSSWIGKAIAESHFVAVVKTPVAPSTSVIVDAKIAEANIKPELLQRRWMALRVRRPMGDPRLPLRELSALCDQLVQAGVEPRTLVPIDSRSYLLLNKEHVHVSVTALVQCGHLVSPAQRVVNALPNPETSTELPEMQVGGWKLLQRQNDGITKDCRKNSIFQSILRVQAKCGFYCEVRTLDPQEVASEFHAQLSSFGMLRSDESRSWRDPLVQFQVSDGSPLPLLEVSTTEGAGEDILLKETERSSSGSAQGPVETWSKLSNSEKVTALELDEENDLQGIWMFAGNLFLRIIGVPRSQSLLASHCCRSLTQLEYFQGMEAVQSELKKYEVLVGEVEESGVLRVHRNTWQGDTGSPASRLLLDARPTDLPKTGSVEVQLESGIVTHQDPDGKELRWRIREWGFDPFTVIEPVVSEPEAVSESESVSETVRVKQKKDAKAASKGAAPKAKAKAKAVATQSPKKEEKETDDEKEEKEVKKKKHKKKEKEKEKEEEKERSRKRASSDSKSSSEVKKKKKKEKSRGRSERKDKKEKDKEKRKKKKGRGTRTASPSKGRKTAARSRSRSRSKRRSRNRKTRRDKSSEHKKEEKKEVKEKQEKPVQERPSEDLSDREVRLKRFADQSKLIPQAMEALRNLKPDLQDKIMEEGPIKEGAGNPIIVLMNRIKEVAEWAQQEADRGEAPEKAPAQAPETTPEEATKANGGTVNGNGTEETEPATLPDQAILLRAFSIQNQLPDTATETLKALPGDVLMNVLVRGPLEAGDPMVALRKRIEEVR